MTTECVARRAGHAVGDRFAVLHELTMRSLANPDQPVLVELPSGIFGMSKSRVACFPRMTRDLQATTGQIVPASRLEIAEAVRKATAGLAVSSDRAHLARICRGIRHCKGWLPIRAKAVSRVPGILSDGRLDLRIGFDPATGRLSIPHPREEQRQPWGDPFTDLKAEVRKLLAPYRFAERTPGDAWFVAACITALAPWWTPQAWDPGRFSPPALLNAPSTELDAATEMVRHVTRVVSGPCAPGVLSGTANTCLNRRMTNRAEAIIADCWPMIAGVFRTSENGRRREPARLGMGPLAVKPLPGIGHNIAMTVASVGQDDPLVGDSRVLSAVLKPSSRRKPAERQANHDEILRLLAAAWHQWSVEWPEAVLAGDGFGQNRIAEFAKRVTGSYPFGSGKSGGRPE